MDGPQPPAPIVQWTPAWDVSLGGKSPRKLSGVELVSLRRAGERLPPFPARDFLLLTNGDRIPFAPKKPLTLEEERLTFTPMWADAHVGVPLAYVAALCRTFPQGDEDGEILLRRLLGAKRPNDVLLLAGGDRVEGRLVALSSAQGFRMKLGESESDTPWEKTALFAPRPEFLAKPRPKGLLAGLVLSDGTRLQCTRWTLATGAAHWEAKTSFGASVRIPLADLRAVQMRQGCATYLSDLIPKSFEHTPFFGVAWPLVADASVTGLPLRLAGQTYDKGLGMHAQSRASYALDGKQRWFEAWVGIHDQAGPRGAARVSVLADGRALENCSQVEIRAGQAPLAIRAEIQGVKVLVLLAEFGAFGDVQAHVDWADARVIRVE
ncbi:MAG: NPCBM/NEW2 domain-containing protein [Gemmataceae bacterium]|nr:NPCBM/NEW2 domain-containing protein [Gemmataceae bacterium]